MRRRVVHIIEEFALAGLALLAAVFAAAWVIEGFGFAAALVLIAIGPLVIVVPLAVILYEEFDRSDVKRGGTR